jgi:(1->4)-alpha-D-glucan 1-alpha-D-glucosylmutase
MVSRWARVNAINRTRFDRHWAPERGDEYLFYQALLGAWPAAGDDLELLSSRMRAYMLKAIREAKLNTSWIQEDPGYERATLHFVEQCLTGRRAAGFLESFRPFATRVARAGAVNSLAQLVLKLASPGVPDFYQGSELWDLNLVDPDNRAPVDFALRRRLLEGLEPVLSGSAPHRSELARALLDRWEDGAIKLYVTACGLRLRRERPAPFRDADYLPLRVSGEAAPHVVALARVAGDDAVLAIAPRLVATLGGDGPPLGLAAWGDTVIHLPEPLSRHEFLDAFTGADQRPVGDDRGATLKVAGLLADLPVSLLATRRA